MDLRSLLSCFSVAVVSIAVWGYVPDTILARNLARKIALGILLGLGAVGSMLIPLQVETGIIFDWRVPLIASAGFVGGPLAAGLAAAMAVLLRIQLGGIGVWAGVVSILSAAMVGSLWHARFGGQTRTRHLVALAATATIAGFATILVLPQAKWSAAMSAAGPAALINFGCTWLFSLSLLRAGQLRELIRTDVVNRAIFQTLPDSLNAKDRQGRFLAANPATARLMQARSPDELIGKTDFDFYAENVASGFRAAELHVLSGNTFGPVDEEVKVPDGSSRWLTSLKTPLRDADGQVTGVITVNRDVTDRKQLEADLSKAQGYLREAMANMVDALVIFDPGGTIKFCNRQYSDLFPLTHDLRVAGGRFSDILREAVRCGEEVPEGDSEAWVASLVQTLHEPGNRVIDLADGRTLEARSRPIEGGDTLIVYSDVTTRMQSQRELIRRATHDPLTGLANRAEFESQLRAAVQRGRGDGIPFAVMMMDLDRFKQVNDTFGHAVGDSLLIEVAARLRRAVRSGDIVARLGGDEFAFLVFGRDVGLGAQVLADRILQALTQPFETGDVTLTPGGSLGIAVLSDLATDPLSLMVAADQALYAAKRQGGNRWIAFPAPVRDGGTRIASQHAA